MNAIVPVAVSDPSSDDIPGVPHPNENAKPSVATGEKNLNWKSTASATAKLLLRGVRDSADAFGPLKAVAGGLCFVLENCEVRPSSCIPYPQRSQVPQRTKANRQAIEALAPRVNALSASLYAPLSEGDAKEDARRKELGQ